MLEGPRRVIFGFSVSIRMVEVRFDSVTVNGRLESKYAIISSVGFPC